MDDRQLSAALEVSSLVRRAEVEGGFAAIGRKGDPDRGAILIVLISRGKHVTCLERVLTRDGGYRWQCTGPGESADSQEVSSFLARRTRFDDDLWIVDLDIAEPERFIAETTGKG